MESGLRLPGDVSLRQIEESDLDALASFANATLARYAGTSRRTAEDLGWRWLRRPGVEPAGTFLAHEDGRIVGYAVVRTNGDIVELMVEPGSESTAVMSVLLQGVESYALSAGAERIVVNVPADRADLVAGIEAAGFGAGEAASLYVSAADPARLLYSLAAHDAYRETLALRVTVTEAKPWQRDAFRLVVSPTGVIVDDEPSTTELELSVGTLAAIAVGSTTPARAWAARELRVHPFSHAPRVLRLLRSLAAEGRWFFHLSDIA